MFRDQIIIIWNNVREFKPSFTICFHHSKRMNCLSRIGVTSALRDGLPSSLNTLPDIVTAFAKPNSNTRSIQSIFHGLN